MNHTPQPIAEALGAYATAVFNKNADAFAKIHHPEVEIFDAWDAWSCHGQAAVLDMARNWFLSLGDERVQVTFSQLASHAGDEVAAVSGLATYTALSVAGEPLRSQTNRISLVLAHERSQWLVVHQHTSVPVGFMSKKAIPLSGAEGNA